MNSPSVISVSSADSRPRRRRSFSPRPWAWALVWTVAWHAGWLFVPPPDVPGKSSRKVEVTPLNYVALSSRTGEGRAAVKDILKVKSPALFAMPREEGFSADFFKTRSAFAPPVNLPGQQELFLDRPRESASKEGYRPKIELRKQAGRQVADLERPVETQPVWEFNAASAVSPAVKLDWMGLTKPESLVPVPEPSETNQIGWEAQFWIKVDELGLVDRWMPDKPSPLREWEIMMEQWAGKLRFGQGPQQGVLKVTFVPGAEVPQ